MVDVQGIFVIKVLNGTTKWWSLLTGGRYSEVVVSSGLTALCPCLHTIEINLQVEQNPIASKLNKSSLAFHSNERQQTGVNPKKTFNTVKSCKNAQFLCTRFDC